MATKSSPKKQKSPAARLGVAGFALAVAYFAVQGGEYGSTDLVRQRGQMARLRHDVDSLQAQVDSLTRFQTAVARDPLMQERLAREQFGMIRGDREILYRFADAPTATGAPH